MSEAHYRDVIERWSAEDGAECRVTTTYARSDRWRRTMLEVTGRRPRVRYHVRVGGVYVQVPWIAWAMFS